jgi:hypothetical protein
VASRPGSTRFTVKLPINPSPPSAAESGGTGS